MNDAAALLLLLLLASSPHHRGSLGRSRVFRFTCDDVLKADLWPRFRRVQLSQTYARGEVTSQ